MKEIGGGRKTLSVGETDLSLSPRNEPFPSSPNVFSMLQTGAPNCTLTARQSAPNFRKLSESFPLMSSRKLRCQARLSETEFHNLLAVTPCMTVTFRYP